MVVLYDPDCGFCRVVLALLLRWDTQGRLRPVALGSEEADGLLRGMPEDERMASWHLVEDARATERFPGASDRAYRWVADHRSLLGRPIPASARRWADRVISGSRPHGR